MKTLYFDCFAGASGNMILGALVALIKLDDYAQVHYGIALASLGGVMILLLAIGAIFNEHETWERLERAR